MAAPKRTMTMIASVKRIRRRSSGIFTVFRNAEIIDKKLLPQKHGHPERSRRIPWHYRKAFATGFLDLARDDGRGRGIPLRKLYGNATGSFDFAQDDRVFGEVVFYR